MSDKNGNSGGKPDVEALREEIKQTRAELGETVQALAAKADVKARAKEQVELTKAKVKAQVRAQAVGATDRVKDAAQLASDKVRGAAVQATDKARESGALEQVQGAGEQVRRNPVPAAAVLAGLVALVGVILIIRGRRR
jgi:hypothetical protein